MRRVVWLEISGAQAPSINRTDCPAADPCGAEEAEAEEAEEGAEAEAEAEESSRRHPEAE